MAALIRSGALEQWSNNNSFQSQNFVTILHPHPGLTHMVKFLPKASRVVTGFPASQAKVVIVSCSNSQTKLDFVLLAALARHSRKEDRPPPAGRTAIVCDVVRGGTVYVSHPSGQAVLKNTSGQTEVLLGPYPQAVTHFPPAKDTSIRLV